MTIPRRPKLIKPLLVLGIIGLGLIGIAKFIGYAHLISQAKTPTEYGISYSPKYARSLGLDWRQTYLDLLDQLQVKQLRLMSYWDEFEVTPGQYRFDDLDWQMDQAQARGAKVILAIGLRQPRWPECHFPAWTQTLSSSDWQQYLLKYIETTVSRYRDHPALESYLLENEYSNVDFGRHCRDFSRQRIVREFDRAKALDSTHPILMTIGNQLAIPVSQPEGDIYGLTVYGRVYEARILKRYISTPIPPWYQSFRVAAIKFLHKTPVIIHELQAEPWTRQPMANTTFAEQSLTMNPQLLKQNLAYAQGTGMRTAYLWGAEWWYWRMTKFDDDDIWQIAKNLLNQANAPRP